MRIALTGCRKGSTRLQGKALSFIGDKGMIEYTLDQMVKCKLFDMCILTTDWMELINRFKDSYPEITFLERPKELALNETPAQAYITYTLEPYHQEGNEYCLLQSTSPLRETALIFETYKEFKGYKSLFTVNKYTLENDGQVYWFRDYKDLYKIPGRPYLCEPSIDIDYERDLRVAEYLMRVDKSE